VHLGQWQQNWEFDDLASQPIEVLRPNVEEIDRRTQGLFAEVLGAASV
jgi:hypothetical protein